MSNQGYQEKNRPSQQLFKALGRFFPLITLIKHAQQVAEPQNENLLVCLSFALKMEM
jgi:hypothetical protein